MKRKIQITVLSLCAALSLGAGMAFVSTDILSASAESTFADSLVMQKGASVRINDTENYKDNGIRFSANISNAEYNDVKKLNNAKFGMFIMPASYVEKFGDLTAENVNVNGVYDWQEDGSAQYFYGGSEIQAESHQIISITYDTLEEDPNKDGYKIIRGSVIGIKDQNLDMDYIGRAFIRYEADGFYFYEMADWYEDYAGNSVRSVEEVSWKAIKDEDSKLTGDEKKALSNSYTVKNLSLNGYTAITNANDFALMTANGKYYLANDITVPSAYASAFTGDLNGNGKTITVSAGQSLFTSFSGTLENVTITASNAPVISTMSGGLVKDVTLTSTWSAAQASATAAVVGNMVDGRIQYCNVSVTTPANDSATDKIYAIAGNSAITAWIDNNVIYTPDSANMSLASGEASNVYNVVHSEANAQYYEITYVAANGAEVVRMVKAGDEVSADKMYKAGSGISGGKVNAWNKEPSIVGENTTYYAKDVAYTYDETKAWKKIASSPLVSATEVGGEIPVGYSMVSVNSSAMNTQPYKDSTTRYFANIDLSAFSDVRFAFMVNGYFLMDGWTEYMADTFVWVYVDLVNNGDGTWTVSMTENTNKANPYYSAVHTGNTLQELVWSWYLNTATDKIWATDVYGVRGETWGTEIVDKAIDSFAETTAKAIPGGYEKVYYLENVEAGVTFADVDISAYEEVRFYLSLTGGYFAIKGWGAYAQNAEFLDAWKLVQLVNNGAGSWTVTINAQLVGGNVSGVPYVYTATGTTLKAVLDTWFEFSGGADVYLTEIRGVAMPPVEMYGTKIVDKAIDGFAETTAKAIPEGFEKVYYLENVAAGVTFADVDISAYEEVRFYLSLTGGYFAIKGWGAFAQNAEFLDAWKLVQLVNDGAGTWTITINAKIAGANVEPYSYTATGTTLKEVLSTWFEFSDGADVYLTEIRGVAMPPAEMYGTKIVDKAIDGFAETTAKAIPSGFEKVYYLENVEAGVTFADVGIAGYEEVRFYLSLTGGYFAIKGWGAYAQNAEFLDAWKLVQLVNNGDGTWTVTINAKIAGANVEPYSYTATGTTLKEVLSTWFSFSEGADVYLTEIRGEKGNPWGELVKAQILKNSTVADESNLPSSYENYQCVYTLTNLSMNSFANVSLNTYAELRFMIKHDNFLMLDGYNRCFGNNDGKWIPVTLVNNGAGNWTITTDVPVYDVNNGWASLGRSYEMTGYTLKDLLGAWRSESTTAVVYVTELRGIEREMPVPEIPESFVELEPQSNPVLWGERVTDSALANAEIKAETAPVGYELVSYKSALNKGDFASVDVSAYTELRFAIKSTNGNGWILFGDWTYYVHTPNEWVTVYLNKQVDTTWRMSVSANVANGKPSPTEYTAKYSGSSLQEILASWYNDASADFYVTELRGSKEEVYVTTDLAFMESPTLTEEAAPSGFSKVYSTAGGFTTDNVSSYKELYFAFKHSSYFLIEGWSGYVDAPNDWVYMSLFNNGDGTWKVVFEGIKTDEGKGVVYLASAMNGYEFGRQERYEKIYSGSTLSAIFASCTPTGSTVFTEIKALKEVEESEAGMKISNLVFTQVVATDGESVPTGYDNVYLKNGLAKGDFATVDISEYAEVNFMFKANGYVQFDDAWVKYVDSRNWVSVHLENTGNGSEWDVYVNDEFTYTCAGTTLNEVLALWHSDYTTKPFQMYVTDLRGIAGGYTIDKVRSIVMSKSDALVADNVSAARALAAEIKALTGKELLIEYYDDVNMLEADGRYLVLGSFALEMGAIEDGLEMETGYKLQRIGNNVCMFGISEYGHLNAVYGFLKEYFGLVYYTDTVNSHVDAPEDAKIGMRETIIFNPSIEYNWIIDGVSKDKDMYADRLGMVELGIGGNGWHNFLTIVSEEEYGASGTVAQHAEWFVTRNSTRTLNITTEENRAGIAAVVAEKFAEQINSSSLKRLQFSAPDFVDASLTTSDYVDLMNKIAEALNPMISRKVELILLAYNSTMEVPQDVTLESYENVMLSVMLAPVEYNYYYDFNNNVSYMNDSEKTNLWFYEQIESWSNVLNDGLLYFWNYSVFFDNYFVPLDTITNMQSKYQALADAGVSVIYDLGMYNDDVGTDWTALKLYLKAELGKNVNANVDALIESFMKAYYGEAAAPYMLQLLNAQQAHYATIANKIPAGNVVRSKLFNKSLWGGDTNDMLVTWYGYIQSALNVTTDKTLRERIHVEGLSIRYLNSAVYATVNILSGKVTDVADLTVTYAANETTGLDDMSKVIADAKALGIDRFAESKGWICNDGAPYSEKNLVDGVIDNLA